MKTLENTNKTHRDSFRPFGHLPIKAKSPYIFDVPDGLADQLMESRPFAWSLVGEKKEEAPKDEEFQKQSREEAQNELILRKEQIKLADIKGFFYDGRQSFMKEGNKNFKETYVESIENLPDEDFWKLFDILK